MVLLRKNLGSIISAYTKLGEDLETFISKQDKNINKKNEKISKLTGEIAGAEAEKLQANRILERTREFIS